MKVSKSKFEFWVKRKILNKETFLTDSYEPSSSLFNNLFDFGY